MLKEMKVVVYRNSETENGIEYSLIYDGTASITDTTTARDVFDPVDAKISELNNYGYEFDHLEFLVDTLGGIGAGGALDFLKQFYDAANEIYKQNPLAFDLLILNFPRIKKLFSKVFDIIQNNLKYYDSFEQGIKFQKEYTLDSFTKALQLEEIRRLNNKMTYFQIVNAFLIVYGYKYDYKNKKWIKS